MSRLGFLSCVVVFQNDSDFEQLPQLVMIMEEVSSNFEIIVCIPPGVLTSEQLDRVTMSNENLAVYEVHARDRDSLMAAGIDLSLGDWIVHASHNHLDEIRVLFKEYEKSKPDMHSFIQVKRNKVSLSDKLLSKIASKVIETEVKTLLPTSRLVSRSSLYSWNNRKMRNKVIRIAPNLESSTAIYVDQSNATTEERDRFLRVGLRTIVHSSAKPLRWVSIASWIAATLALLASIIVFFVGLYSNVVPGWTTTNLQIGLMSFFILTVLGFLTEYIYQITATSIAQPVYTIRKEQLSKSFKFKDQNNVTSQN